MDAKAWAAASVMAVGAIPASVVVAVGYLFLGSDGGYADGFGALATLQTVSFVFGCLILGGLFLWALA